MKGGRMSGRIPKKVVVSVIIAFAAIWTYLKVYYPLDGLTGVVFGTLFHTVDTTEYASGYCDKAFRKLNRGMSSSEVRALLGAPLSKWDLASRRELAGDEFAEMEAWVYSRSKNDGDYRIRTVHFNSGKVTRVYSEYYVD